MSSTARYVQLGTPQAYALILGAIIPKAEALHRNCPQSVGFEWRHTSYSFADIFMVPLLDVEFCQGNPHHVLFSDILNPDENDAV